MYLCWMELLKIELFFDIETVLTLNWIIWNRTVLAFNCAWTKTILILNWIVWNRTVISLLYPGFSYIRLIYFIYINTGSNLGPEKIYLISESHISGLHCSKVRDHNREGPEGSLFISYFTEMEERMLPLYLDCSTLPLVGALWCWVISKLASRTIFWVFGMTRPGHCWTLFI